MNEKFNKNAKEEQLTKVFLSRGEETALSLKILYHNDGAMLKKKSLFGSDSRQSKIKYINHFNVSCMVLHVQGHALNFNFFSVLHSLSSRCLTLQSTLCIKNPSVRSFVAC